jgi:hypothetical protein
VSEHSPAFLHVFILEGGNSRMTILGIDPGAHGAIAILDEGAASSGLT